MKKIPRLSWRWTLSGPRKWLLCIWKHKDHRCYPEIWDRGPAGPWHCDKCHPCGEELDRWARACSEELPK